MTSFQNYQKETKSRNFFKCRHGMAIDNWQLWPIYNIHFQPQQKFDKTGMENPDGKMGHSYHVK